MTHTFSFFNPSVSIEMDMQSDTERKTETDKQSISGKRVRDECSILADVTNNEPDVDPKRQKPDHDKAAIHALQARLLSVFFASSRRHGLHQVLVSFFHAVDFRAVKATCSWTRKTKGLDYVDMRHVTLGRCLSFYNHYPNLLPYYTQLSIGPNDVQLCSRLTKHEDQDPETCVSHLRCVFSKPLQSAPYEHIKSIHVSLDWTNFNQQSDLQVRFLPCLGVLLAPTSTTKIESLHLNVCGHYKTVEAQVWTRDLCAILRNNTTLRSIHITVGSFDSLHLYTIQSMVRAARNIHELKLIVLATSTAHVARLNVTECLDAIQHHPSITNLNIYCHEQRFFSPLPNPLSERLAEMVNKMQHLQTVRVAIHTQRHKFGMLHTKHSLLSLCETHPSIQHLTYYFDTRPDFWRTREAEHDFWTSLSKTLGANTSLKRLDLQIQRYGDRFLSENNIGILSVFLSNVSVNNTLQELDLTQLLSMVDQNSSCLEKTLHSLTQMIRSMKALQKLSLTRCFAGPNIQTKNRLFETSSECAPMAGLGDVFAENPSLECLELDGGVFHLSFLKHLEAAMQSNTHLKRLNFAGFLKFVGPVVDFHQFITDDQDALASASLESRQILYVECPSFGRFEVGYKTYMYTRSLWSEHHEIQSHTPNDEFKAAFIQRFPRICALWGI